MEFISTNHPATYKALMEKTYMWIKAKEEATNGATTDQREGSDKFSKGFS